MLWLCRCLQWGPDCSARTTRQTTAHPPRHISRSEPQVHRRISGTFTARLSTSSALERQLDRVLAAPLGTRAPACTSLATQAGSSRRPPDRSLQRSHTQTHLRQSAAARLPPPAHRATDLPSTRAPANIAPTWDLVHRTRTLRLIRQPTVTPLHQR